MSRNFSTRVTLYRQAAKAPLWFLPKNPEIAWPDGQSCWTQVRSSWTVTQRSVYPRSFMYCSSRSGIRKEPGISLAVFVRSFSGKKDILLAARAMPAPVGSVSGIIIGPAAAGISVF